ncbi:response regulator transcription factor [Ureibacillus sp. NPDC094379]
MTRLLIAEDEEVLRMLIVDIFEDEDYTIDVAGDGGEAWEYLKENQYDLVLLDYMMPVYTGLEIVEKIRSSEINKYTKILMLSAKSQEFEQKQALEIGANYFMAKPFSPIKLLELVGDILNENN